MNAPSYQKFRHQATATLQWKQIPFLNASSILKGAPVDELPKNFVIVDMESERPLRSSIREAYCTAEPLASLKDLIIPFAKLAIAMKSPTPNPNGTGIATLAHWAQLRKKVHLLSQIRQYKIKFACKIKRSLIYG
jgi:hypothetical protein